MGGLGIWGFHLADSCLKVLLGSEGLRLQASVVRMSSKLWVFAVAKEGHSCFGWSLYKGKRAEAHPWATKPRTTSFRTKKRTQQAT